MLVFEKSPWQWLPLIVLPQAILLSRFVLIGQNGQDACSKARPIVTM